MARLRCVDYGFTCEFEAAGETQEVIKEFGEHTEEHHGIDYSKEALLHFIARKKS